MTMTHNDVHNAQSSTSSNVQSTQDTINNGIIENLSRAAQEYFGTLERVPVGTYTARDICDMEKKRDLTLENYDIYTCKVGTFECSFPKSMIFRVLHQYEKIFKVSSAKRAKFTQSKQVKAASEFIITFPKATKELSKHVGKDTYRPVLCGVCIDTANSALVATDTKVLSEVRAEVDVCSGEHCKVLIDAKTAKALAGKSAIVEVGEDGKAVITAESGETYEGKTTRNYPDYRRALPNISREGYIKFGKDAIKEFTKFCKMNGGNIEMRIAKGSEEVILKSYIADDGEMKLQSAVTLQLESDAQCEGVLMFDTEVFKKVAQWNGGIWLTNCRPIVFDCNGMEYTIIMPLSGTQMDISGEVMPCMERNTTAMTDSEVIVKVVTEPITKVIPNRAENLEIEHTEVVSEKATPLKRETGIHSRVPIDTTVCRVPIDSVIMVGSSEFAPKIATTKFTGTPSLHISLQNNAIFCQNRKVSCLDREMYLLGVCVPYRANMTQITRKSSQGCSGEIVGTRAREPGTPSDTTATHKTML